MLRWEILTLVVKREMYRWEEWLGRAPGWVGTILVLAVFVAFLDLRDQKDSLEVILASISTGQSPEGVRYLLYMLAGAGVFVGVGMSISMGAILLGILVHVTLGRIPKDLLSLIDYRVPRSSWWGLVLSAPALMLPLWYVIGQGHLLLIMKTIAGITVVGFVLRGGSGGAMSAHLADWNRRAELREDVREGVTEALKDRHR